MSQPVLSTDEVLTMLRAEIGVVGSQETWAKAHGISGKYLNDIMRGRRGLGDALLRGLGLQKAAPTYVPREPEEVVLYDTHGITLLVARTA